MTFFSEKHVTLRRRTYIFQLSTPLAGLYIHIPFCRSRCAYCDFYSTTREAEAATYVDALCREMEARRCELPHARVHSIYIGGGTPSVLPPSLLHRILDRARALYDVADDAEVTVEMNPDDWPLSNSPRGGEDSITSEDKNEDIGYAALPPTGGAGRGAFNRVSLGIQTFDDSLLRLIRRRHDAATAIRAVQHLQAAGIANISIDLIYGLPGQTLEQWEHDLDTAFSLGIQHLSAYALSYEPGTALTRWRDEGRIREATDELSVQMYQRLCQRARGAGFEHYEISNFALPGFASRHNSSYWTAVPYLGFGPGAHSYDGHRTRRANPPSLTAYLAHWLSPTTNPASPPTNPASPTANPASPTANPASAPSGSASPTINPASAPSGSALPPADSASRFHRDASPTLEHLTDDELYDEAVMCGLRTARGIDLDSLAARFGAQRLRYLLRQAAPHLHAARLVNRDHHLRLTEQSLMISDDIMSDLMA